MRTAQPKKRNYSAMKLPEAMQLVGRESLTRWRLDAPTRLPDKDLQAHLQRLEVFDLESTEQAKTLLIDALFAEIVFNYPKLKIWKSEPLETDTLTGTADYLMAPRRAYLATPLLCVTEAKRDDFEKGRVQCLAEMVVCQWNNRQSNLDVDIYGIVSNGQGWRFYKLTRASDAYETNQYGIEDLPGLLGALDYVCGECAKNVP
ncbi:MAG: hypothetical protein H7308_03890 [Chthonomonadaceae bacterium]|nr:hypothetical protein [Chthonomonadaceae bacterium]